MHLAKYIYTSGVPFRHAANKHLIAAFSTLGVTIQNEKWFRTSGLGKVHEEVQTAAIKDHIAHITPFVYDIQIKCCRLG